MPVPISFKNVGKRIANSAEQFLLVVPDVDENSGPINFLKLCHKLTSKTSFAQDIFFCLSQKYILKLQLIAFTIIPWLKQIIDLVQNTLQNNHSIPYI